MCAPTFFLPGPPQAPPARITLPLFRQVSGSPALGCPANTTCDNSVWDNNDTDITTTSENNHHAAHTLYNCSATSTLSTSQYFHERLMPHDPTLLPQPRHHPHPHTPSQRLSSFIFFCRHNLRSLLSLDTRGCAPRLVVWFAPCSVLCPDEVFRCCTMRW